MDLVNRLKFFLEKNNIAISQFADTCGIPRPTLSQILNGRNKKISDELISKIHAAYPALSILWLMFGEGSMESAANIEVSEPQKQSSEEASPIYKSGYERSADEPGPVPGKQFFQTENQFPADGLFAASSSVADDSFASQEFTNKEMAAAFGAADATNGEEKPQVTSTENDSSPISSGSISFYPRQEGRPTQKVTSQYSNPPDSAPSSPATNDAGELKAEGVADSFVPYIPPAPEPYGASPSPKPYPRQDNPTSVSVPADPEKRITNIVVFYSDNSFQSFSPS